MNFPRTFTAIALALLLVAGCVDSTSDKSTPGLAASAGGIAGIAADQKTALDINKAMVAHVNGDAALVALLTEQALVLGDQVGHIAEATKASETQATETTTWKSRAMKDESAGTAESKARFDWACIIALFAMAGSIVLRAYAPATSSDILKGSTTALAVVAGATFAASLLTGVVASAMVYIGPALGICLVFLVVFWAITHKKILAQKVQEAAQSTATLTNAVSSVNTALAAIPAEAAVTAKNVMADIQTPATQAAVQAIKAGLPVMFNTPTPVPATPATGA